MKSMKVFHLLRAAVVAGALVGALAAPGMAAAGNRDTDGDGLRNGFERNWTHTNPNRADSDHDGVRDGKEDPDRDGLTNKQEQTVSDDPQDADTDNDDV